MKKTARWLLLIAMLVGCFVFNGHMQTAQAKTQNEKGRAWVKVYEKKIKKLNKQNKGYTYQLIYVNKDDVPELVVEDNTNYNCDISMYTYGNGKLHLLMDHWMYGMSGALDYQYIPKKNIIYSCGNSDAGMYRFDSYMVIKKNKLVDKYKKRLSSSYDGEKYNYYFGDKKISEKKYNSYQIDGKYKVIKGKYSYKQIMKKLRTTE